MPRKEKIKLWRNSVRFLLLLLSCTPSHVSHMRLDLDVGYSIAYRVAFWPQDRPETTRVRMVVHTTEVSDLAYFATARITGDEEGTIIMEVSSGGKVMETESHGLSDYWPLFLMSGLSPFAPLAQEPVSPGQSWRTTLINGKGVYTYKGKGFLEGRQGHILEFTVTGDSVQARGKLAISPENGMVQAAAGAILTDFGAFGYRMARE